MTAKKKAPVIDSQLCVYPNCADCKCMRVSKMESMVEDIKKINKEYREEVREQLVGIKADTTQMVAFMQQIIDLEKRVDRIENKLDNMEDAIWEELRAKPSRKELVWIGSGMVGAITIITGILVVIFK